MASQLDSGTVLVNHDGELADVLALLGDCGLQAIERRGPPTRQDVRTPWRLVVATPKRMVKLEGMDARNGAVRVAVVDDDSRTLRAMLQRMAVDFIVRRPVHPAALRLLILHSLYRGPEKRGGGRVGIGAPVRFRCGLRKRPAVLADLSIRGCRLLSAHAAPEGYKVTLYLPGELGSRRVLPLKGKVKRCGPAEDGAEGAFAIGVIFEGLGAPARSGVKAVLDAHARGPATWDDEGALSREQALRAGDSTEGSERRTDPRRVYDRHVIALAADATRVLLGRDISLGGMRVDPSPDLKLGGQFQLAIHGRARTEPLVVDARVARDDGEQGLVLEFAGLSSEASEHLGKMICSLPILAGRDEGGVAVVVSEILAREGAG